MEETTQQELWMEAQITRKENDFFQQIIGCDSQEAVETAVTFASFINQLGLTPENYLVFLSMLEIENHHVVDALIGKMDPFTLLSAVQPNEAIISRIFSMIGRWNRGGIYPKNLSVILGVLQDNFTSAEDGFRIFSLDVADVNSMGKHLDKSKSQDNPINRAILDILDSISSLKGEEGSIKEAVALQAAAIRNAFFDDRKSMDDVIPAALLTKDEQKKTEIKPRRVLTIEEIEKPAKKESAAASKKTK